MDPIESAVVDAILDYFAGSFVGEESVLVGAEFERIAVDARTGRRIPYSGERGIAQLLQSWIATGATLKSEEAGSILALESRFGVISLEEGSQVELATHPVTDLHQLRDQHEGFESVLMRAADDRGYRWLAVGVDPLSTPDELELIPKEKSRVILKYLRDQGPLASAMPFLTASMQVSIDYCSAQDVVDKLRAGLALSPYVTAMFVNSPFYRGEATGHLSFRTNIWHHTDPTRCGLFESLMTRDDWSLEDYATTLARQPLIYGYDARGELVAAHGRTLVEMMRDVGRRPTTEDVWASSRQFWTEVRLKSVLEFRGMDCPPPGLAACGPALWIGLLYDAEARERAWNIVRVLDVAERSRLWRDVAERGIHAETRGQAIRGTCMQLVELAADGLRRRKRLDALGRDESILLRPLVTMLEHGVTAAEVLLQQWRRDPGARTRLDLARLCSHDAW